MIFLVCSFIGAQIHESATRNSKKLQYQTPTGTYLMLSLLHHHAICDAYT